MPFAFRERGERSKLAEHIKTVTENGTDGKPVKDQVLLETVKASVIAALKSLPKEFNGALVMIDLNGNENTRAGSFQVIGEKGHY